MKKTITHSEMKRQHHVTSVMKKILTSFTVLLILSFAGYAQDEVQNLPLFVDFENYAGINLSEIADGWYEAKNQPPEEGSGGWYQSEVLYDDVHAAIELYSNTHREWIISPRFYVTEDTKVSFDASMTYAHDEPREGSIGGDDEFAIMVSTDGGNSFQPLYTFTNSSSKTLEYNFKRFTFSLSEYSGSNIQVGFFATDGNQEDGAFALHLDDIMIKNKRANDAFAFDILQPSKKECYTSDQLIVAEVKNEGYEALANIPVRIKVRGQAVKNVFNVVNGPIEPNQKVQFEVGTFDMAAAGDYELTMQTELENDSFPLNNQQTKTITNHPLHQLPLEKLTFSTSYGDIGDSYDGWSEARGESWPKATMNTDWQSDNYSGERGVSVYFSNVSTIDWLISPKFTPSSDTKLSFDHALSLEDGVTSMGSDDQMNIMVTTDCGATWTKLDSITKDSEVSSAWQDYVIDLSDFEGETIQLAFYAYTGRNNDSEKYLYFLDNIDIREMYNHDAGVTEITSPGAPAEFSANETIKAIIKNYGTAEAVDLEVAYQLNDNEPVVETVSTSIPPKESLEYTFSQTANLTVEENDTISVYTQLEDDGNPENNGVYDKALNTSSFDPSSEGTFTASFEPDESLTGWFSINNNNDEAEWQLVDDPASAYHGDYAYAYSSKGITSQSDDWLFSPAMELVGGDTYHVSFYFSNEATNFPEKIKLGLATAQNVDSVNTTLVDLGQIDNNEYLKAEINFTADSNDHYYLAWHAYGDPDQLGMHIDYVQLRKVFNHDIQVSDLQIPRQKDPVTGQLMNIDTAKVTVNNLGQNMADAFTVHLAYNEEDTLTQDFTQQNVLSGNEKEVIFDNNLDLPYDEVYNFKLWTESTEDLNAANDTFELDDFYLKHYTTSFEANEDLSAWKTVDVAGTDYSWEIIDDDTKAHSGTRCYQLPSNAYDPNLTSNEDWLFTEGFYLEKDKCYKVGFWYNAYYSEEKLTFMIGQEQNVSMEDTLIDFGIIGDGTYKEWQYKEIAVSVEQTGQYYFGWHANGSMELSRYRLLIDDFELQQNFNFEPGVTFSYKKLDTEYYFESNTTHAEWFHWDFDDGSHSDKPALFHKFEEEGTYAVQLKAGNACAVDSLTKNIDMVCDVEASFSYTIDNNTVTFTNNSTAADGYYWQFGNDSVSTVQNPEHTYDNPGEYTVTLEAIGSCGIAETEQTLVIDSSASALDDHNAESTMQLFPNPVENILSIDLQGNRQIESFVITTITGQMVLERNAVENRETSVNFSNMAPGTYLIKVLTSDGHVITKKVTKQ